jgi:hypothetical protein
MIEKGPVTAVNLFFNTMLDLVRLPLQAVLNFLFLPFRMLVELYDIETP